MTPELLRFLDAHADFYWWFAGAAVALVVLWSWGLGRTAPDRHASWWMADWIALVLLTALLVTWRHPLLLETKSAGLAESQLLASALGVERDPGSFRLVDAGDNGLLTVWALLPSHWLGLPQDFFNARLVALLFDCAALAAGYCLLRRWFSRGMAMLGLLPLALVMGAARAPAFYEYSAWHPAALLLALAAARLRPGTGRDALPGWRVCGRVLTAAVWLGAIPWTHRGAGLAAVALWAVAAALAWRNRQSAPQHLRFVVQAGALALYGDVAGVCLLHGIGQDGYFWASYVRGLAGGQSTIPTPTNAAIWHGCLAASLAATGLFVLWNRRPRLVAAIWAALAGVVLAMHVGEGRPQILGHVAVMWAQPRSELGGRLRAMRFPNDTLAVWGWRPQLHLETGLPPVTGSATTLGEISEKGARGPYRPHYLAELLRNPPTIFVDAGALGLAGYGDRAKSGHEVFPELTEFIAKHYRLVSDDGVIRLYLRAKDDVEPAAHHERLRLEKVKIVKALAPVTVVERGHWFAHAPCRFAYPVSPDAVGVGGVFGFLPAAYEDSSAITDGATFIVEATGVDGRRERLLERRLAPAANPADRGPISFAVALPSTPSAEIEFIIEPGDGSSRDWTYWGDLQFERAR